MAKQVVATASSSEPKLTSRPSASRLQGPAPRRSTSTSLPETGAELFGRERELKLLDEAWANETTNVVSLVAWGGVGKSTLVNKWLEGLKADNWRGAQRVFGWSFFSQGTGERATSADQFIDHALRFFNDPEPEAGSPWARASGWPSWPARTKRS